MIVMRGEHGMQKHFGAPGTGRPQRKKVLAVNDLWRRGRVSS